MGSRQFSPERIASGPWNKPQPSPIVKPESILPPVPCQISSITRGGPFNLLNQATPPPTSTPAPTQIVIEPRPIVNEIHARPGFDWNQDGRADVFDEFIEIKNLTAIDISLSGWKLDTVNGKKSFTLPDVTLKPGERIVYYSKETNLLLSDGGETVRLIRSTGKIYDAFTYTVARAEDQSFCRLPDGNPGDSWFEDCVPTPNLTNTR